MNSIATAMPSDSPAKPTIAQVTVIIAANLDQQVRLAAKSGRRIDPSIAATGRVLRVEDDLRAAC